MEPQASILILDTDSEELMQLLTFLEESYLLTDIQDGGDFLRQAEQLAPDLILLDDMVAEPNCYDICQSLKASELTERVPIILMSDLTASELDQEINSLGADDYICRPIQRDELREKIATLLSFSAVN